MSVSLFSANVLRFPDTVGDGLPEVFFQPPCYFGGTCVFIGTVKHECDCGGVNKLVSGDSERPGAYKQWSGLITDLSVESKHHFLSALERGLILNILKHTSYSTMLFSVSEDGNELHRLDGEEFANLDILERADFQEWAVEEPALLGEDLLVIASEYSNFEQTRDRLDILAIDPEGKLVVVELKRDEADRTTDLQAIKYASYCATLTAEEVQRDYRMFWNDRNDTELSPEEVGQKFAKFLDESVEEGVPLTDEGWADFELDDRPRILLVAGKFGIQVTAPVIWLIEEYDIDITCVTVTAHEYKDEILLSKRQVIPVAEAEEYMTRRREKDRDKDQTEQRDRSIIVLLERGILQEGDRVEFCEDKKPDQDEWKFEPDDDFWRAEVTGKTGRTNNVQWYHDDETYSFTRLTKTLLDELMVSDRPARLNGYRYWCHPEFEYRSLLDLRNSQVEASDRKPSETN